MAHGKTERNPLFAGRWFEDDIILLCLRWYFRFKLSYRDLVAILGERGLLIAHTTILRWGIRYAETCEKRWRRLRGFHDLSKVITGVKFNDGIEVSNVDQAAA